MPYNYTPFEKLADRLVTQFGTTAAILRSETGEPVGGDPLRPWEGNTGPTEVITAYPCTILIGSFSDIEVIASGTSGALYLDHKIMVVRKGLLIEPRNSDMIQLTNEDRAFQIQSVKPIMPGGHIIYWQVTAR